MDPQQRVARIKFETNQTEYSTAASITLGAKLRSIGRFQYPVQGYNILFKTQWIEYERQAMTSRREGVKWDGKLKLSNELAHFTISTLDKVGFCSGIFCT